MMICKPDTLAAAGPLRRRIQQAQTAQPRRDTAFHATLSGRGNERLDIMAAEQGVPRSVIVERALNLLFSVNHGEGR